MIYDMYGFPEELYDVRYSALGSSSIARKITQELAGEYDII